MLTFCSAHVQGHRHKKMLASLRKQAKLLATAKTDGDQGLVDEHTDTVEDSHVDSVDEVISG